jgi:hypothetical protein
MGMGDSQSVMDCQAQAQNPVDSTTLKPQTNNCSERSNPSDISSGVEPEVINQDENSGKPGYGW